MQTFLSGCRNPGDRDSGETAFRASGRSAPVPERAAPVRSRRSGRLPCRPARKPGHSGHCPSLSRRDLPRGRHRHQPQPDLDHRHSGDPVPGFASDGQGAGCRSPECGASALRKIKWFRMLVSSTLLKVSVCPAGTATRPPCPTTDRSAAQGRPKPAPARFFLRLFRTLRGYLHIAPLPIRINNRPFVGSLYLVSSPCQAPSLRGTASDAHLGPLPFPPMPAIHG